MHKAQQSISGAAGYPLLVIMTVTGLTTYMVYPMLTLELVANGLSMGQAGVVLGVLSGVGPILSSTVGRAIERYGSKFFAVSGLLLRAIGLSIFLIRTTVPVYCAMAALASLGSSAESLAVKTELMRRSMSRRMVTLRSLAINSGALVGPAIGAALYHWLNFKTLILIASVSYLLLSVALSFIPFRPPERNVQVSAVQNEHSVESANLWANLSFLLIMGLTMAYWMVYAQWSLVVPISAYAGFGSKESSNAIYIGNAVFILLVQYPLLVHGMKHLKDTTIAMVGFASFIAAFLVLPACSGLFAAVGFAACFSLGELLVSPTLDVMTGKIEAEGSGLSRAYGWTGTCSGVASLVGSSLGGYAIDRFGGLVGVSALSLVFLVSAVALTVGLHRREVG